MQVWKSATVLLLAVVFVNSEISDNDNIMHPHIVRPSIHAPNRHRLNNPELETSFWVEKAQKTLREHVRRKQNTNKAKNIILFLGDGMSIPTLAAARMYMGNENKELSFEKFPHTALSKTYSVDTQTSDSACTATAYLCGIKANDGTIGVNGNVKYGDGEAMNNKENHVSSIAKWAQEAGKGTGIVTTARVTHASPAGAYAHTAHRDWESDGNVAKAGFDPKKTLDIATQLINTEPGKNFKVILGGGRMHFLPNTTVDEEGSYGQRRDNINLINKWKSNHVNQAASYVWNKKQLKSLNYKSTNYLLGLFESSHCRYNLDVVEEKIEEMEPSLTEMVEAAIAVLNKERKGYFLFVEGGRIDHAHHDVLAKKALDETVEFSKAIQKAVDLTSQDDTLIVVTSDHSHTMSVSGYPERGNPILGYSDISAYPPGFGDGLPYATLSYANGPGYSDHITADGRQDFSEMNYEDNNFKFPSAVPLMSETHGGDDVGIFARGPWSHLFAGTLEQNVIPHFMAYASCVGNGPTACSC